jgi:hypothetical protein
MVMLLQRRYAVGGVMVLVLVVALVMAGGDGDFIGTLGGKV